MFRSLKYGKLVKMDLPKYHDFTSFQEADDWARNYYGKWIEDTEKISVRGLRPFTAFGGNMYKSINDRLCFDDYCQHELTLTLLQELSKAPAIPQDIILYRAVEKWEIDKLIVCNKNGMPLCIKQLISTTLLKGVLIKNDKSIETKEIKNKYEIYQDYKYILKIYASRGTKGAYIDLFKNHLVKREAEMLIPQNSKFKLIKYPYKDNDKKFIYECLLEN